MGYWIYEEDILHQMVYSQLRVNNLAEYIVLILISTLYHMETVN